MAKVKKDWDPTSDGVDMGNKFEEHPGLDASSKAIADTPGEKATNDPAAESTSKAQPFGPGGSGYTKKN